MRARLLCCAAAALAVSCVKRINPDPGEDRTSYSGVPLGFGQKQDLPEGTTISWNFGDGSGEVTGAQAVHAFPRAGVFTVVETVRDKDGQTRTGRTHVVALRRAVAMAVPGDARAALLVERPWMKMQVHREVAGKLALGGFFDDLARSLTEATDFDVLDPKACEQNGFDPDEGLAMFTLPQDPEALVIAVGTSDDAKAMEATRRLLVTDRGWGRAAAGPFQLIEQKLPDGTPMIVGTNRSGEKIGVTQRLGYLYLRTPGVSDPMVALRSAAALPADRGLAVEETFRQAARQIGGGDAIFYSRPDVAHDGRFSNALGATAFALQDQPDLVQVRAWSQIKNLKGDALKSAFQPSKPPPDLAARLPAGAAAYLRISAAPAALWRELARASGADASRMRDRVYELTGLDVEKDLLPYFTGNVGVGVYLDAASLIDAVLGEQVGSFDRSAFLAAAELSNQEAISASLDRAMKSRPATDRAQIAGASYYRLGDGAQAAIKDGLLYLAIGGVPAREPAGETAPKRKKPKAPKPLTTADLGVLGTALSPGAGSLSRELKAAKLAGFDVAGQQDVWIDLSGIARSVERAGTEQGGAVGQGARIFAERAGSLRDALFETRPSNDGSGMDADLWVRFRARKPAGR